MPNTTLLTDILAYVESVQTDASPAEITDRVGMSRPTVNRALAKLVADGRLVMSGSGRSTRYRLPSRAESIQRPVQTVARALQWSPQSQTLIATLPAPLGERTPVAYQRAFVDAYEPNVSSLLPSALAEELHAAGRLHGQQPAGTYLRKVLEQLLIDLSWHSSRLEGNRKSLLDTRELFERGRSAHDDPDATMLLNHKEAIEFLADAVPTDGMIVPIVRNLQSVLKQGLLHDDTDLGAIRHKIVHIQDSVYLPAQMPSLLEEMLEIIVGKARRTQNPVEAAFFLWVNLAYLQPFVDGNKRTSRLAANMPLLLANCAPLSFLDVTQADYAEAMLGVYEQTSAAMAVDLFAWTYRRSIAKYRVIEQAMGVQDPLRVRLREKLNDAIQQIVYHGNTLASTLASLSLEPDDVSPFKTMLEHELKILAVHNCARYRLPLRKTREWIDAGRPC
ncbi:Fic family protein [Paraburkholderia sp. SOS3]|uniref:Fic family protein n=1 Tax=Paraburkholderia sp. SOS3 TaxID=1926494 RepID=UPI0009475299|nr:Fic family protein [Paraburkholderia sp. SOS3]APR36476.1 cell filamentation protein Fic [Paraburkholderia sp. SOS3]